MPAKDALASGARSATFSAGRAKKNDPIEFHGTVALAEPNEVARVEEFASPTKPAANLSKYQPMNDRVLLRRIVETKSERLVDIPDSFKASPNIAEVIAVGSGMMIGNQLIPIPLAPADVVMFGEYGVDEIEVEGETLLMISAFDVRLRIAQ